MRTTSRYSSFAGEGDNKYTKGGEYTTEYGEEYIGEYYTIKSGDAFEGPMANPNNSAPNSTVVPKRLYSFYQNFDHFVYDRLFKFHPPQKFFTQPIPYLYRPKEAEGVYVKGYDLRYFVQRHNADTYAIEVNGQQYNQIGKEGGIDDRIYAYAAVHWQLTGTLTYIETTNRLNVNVASQDLPALPYAINSYTQFASPTLQTVFNDDDAQLVTPQYRSNTVTIKQTYDRQTGRIIPV